MSEHGWMGVLEPEPGRPWWTRMGWISKLVLSLGALATAFGAIGSLLPSPDPEDSARFTSVRVTPQVPLTEYQQRAVGSLERDVVLLAAPVPPPPEQSPVTQETVTAPPTAGTPDAESSRELEIGSGIALDPPARSASDTASIVGIVDASDGLPNTCDENDPACQEARWAGILPLVHATPDGDSPEQAAEALLAMFEEVRTVASAALPPVGGEGPEGGATGPPVPAVVDEPLGAVVGLDVELVGLRDRSVLLTWSLWRQGGEARLYGEWLATNPAYRLLPSSQRDTAGLELWVPLPKEPGPYFVRLTLSVDDASLASADSGPVD